MELKVPTKINDIPLQEYQRYAKVNVPDADQEFLMHKTIEIFCEVDIRDVAKLPLKTAEELVEEITNVLNEENSFTSRFTLEGTDYGFIPDLEKITLGEYIDLEEGLKDPASFHKAAAVMFRPIRKQYKELYTIEPYTADTAEIEKMKGAPLGVISAAVVFFYNIVNELQAASLPYSKTLLTESKTTLERVNSQQNTGGLTASTLLVREILQSMKE
jgi:hypothetical protein